MNEILIILITFCSILLLFIAGRFLIKKTTNLIEKVMESEPEITLGRNYW